MSPFGAQTDLGGSTLTVGTNTYVSLADAETELLSWLDTTSWDAASDPDKSAALITATRAIDGLRLIGRRSADEQTLEFPRDIYRGTRGDIGHGDPNYSALYYSPAAELDLNSDWETQAAVPTSVVRACCVEAAARLEDTANTRANLRAQGVSAASLGSASETFGGAHSGLMSGDALSLMRPWIGGTAIIR